MAAVLLAAWLTSLALHDSEKMRDARRDFQAVRQGETPFSWDFSSRYSIDGGHGLRIFRWNGDTLSGRGEALYFSLNLEGRAIDARRYKHIRIRMFSERPSELRLYHRQLGDAGAIHAGEPVAVEPGWQTLELDLEALWWGRKSLAEPDRPDRPSGWGRPGPVVTSLRIDPVTSGSFEVDQVDLIPTGGMPPYPGRAETFSGLDDPVFMEMRHSGSDNGVLAQRGWFRTPESASWQRKQVAGEFPNAIVFPRMPSAGDLSQPAPGTLKGGLLTWLALLAVAGSLAARRKLDPKWRDLSEVVALFVVIGLGIYWMPGLPLHVRLILAVPLFGLLWWLRPPNVRGWLCGNPRAWWWISPLLVIPLAILVAAEATNLEWPRLGRLLGLYFTWALVQQYMVAVLVLPRLERVDRDSAVVMAAAIFGFLHLPNFALMAGTFLLGIIWLEFYRRSRNLLAIALSHAVLAVCATELLPPWLLHSKNVGLAYLATL